jgi:hypothetical protein
MSFFHFSKYSLCKKLAFSASDVNGLITEKIILIYGKETFEHFFSNDLKKFPIYIYTAKMANNLQKKKLMIYECKFCAFTCLSQKDWERHIATRKHKRIMLATETINFENGKNPRNYAPLVVKKACEFCGKTYNHASSLSKHRKKCLSKLADQPQEIANTLAKPESPPPPPTPPAQTFESELTELVKGVMQDNSEFRKIIVKQQEQISEMIPKIGNTTINNTTNNLTNNFNLNIFLNENCKDALNIKDFVQSLKMEVQDLETTGRLGYISGVSNIIIKNLEDLDIHKRPIHCSDLKREIIYIKDNDAWEKENSQKDRLREAIEHVGRTSVKKIPDWLEQNPGSEKVQSLKHDEYMNIVANSLDSTPDHERNVAKIMKNVAKNVALEKDKIMDNIEE